MRFEDFLKRLYDLHSKGEAFDFYLKTIYEMFDIDRVVYSFLTNHHLIEHKAGHGLFSNYPDEWLKRYDENKYILIDPTIQVAPNVNEPVLWDGIGKYINLSSEQSVFMSEARECGLNNGIGVPVHGARGELAGFGLAFSDNKICIDDDVKLTIIQSLSQAFHNHYCKLSQKKSTNIPQLSKREKEVLQWIAIGKTVDDISNILGIHSGSVKFHIKNIYLKLEANSKTLAVVKALRLGLIEFDRLASV